MERKEIKNLVRVTEFSIAWGPDENSVVRTERFVHWQEERRFLLTQLFSIISSEFLCRTFRRTRGKIGVHKFGSNFINGYVKIASL